MSVISNNGFVWALDLPQIERLFDETQLNNYVYAALKLVREGAPPAGRLLHLIPAAAPGPVSGAAAELLALAPRLGRDDPRLVRVHATYRAFGLFRSFAALALRDVDPTIELLASLAFIPILAEKHDHFPIWYHAYPRPMDPVFMHALDALCDDADVTADPALRWELKGQDVSSLESSPMSTIFGLIPRLAQAIIVCDENGVDRDRIATAWRNLERQTRSFELEHRLVDVRGERVVPRNRGMIRYRNTLYLYGGEFFRRQGETDTAITWLLRDIEYDSLPEESVFYLTDMKSVERLLVAARLSAAVRERLRPLVRRAALSVFHAAASYATDVLREVDRNPGVDLGAPRIQGATRPWLFAGEASREPFLFSLLYRWVMNGADLAFPDYRRFFAFE